MKRLLISPWVLWILILSLVIILIWMLFSSVPTKNSPSGFVLPQGDVIAGKKAFVDLGCVTCHSVYGETFATTQTIDRSLIVPLGGEVHREKPYGRLVTAITHPSWQINEKRQAYVSAEGKSLMPEYRTAMTIDQLSNLVYFLSDHYTVSPPNHPYFRMPSYFPY